MNKEFDDNGSAEFEKLLQGVKPLAQDTLHFRPPVKSRRDVVENSTRQQAEVVFSDIYQPLLPSDAPMRWNRDDIDPMEVKRLRRGDYVPEYLLDLHGMRQAEAKREIAALIQACIRQNSPCCCIMHGHGTGILKQQLPIWLAQHPDVKAFHKATKEWGGDAALLVLVEVAEQEHRR
ncbi:endonuclease SmrB [Shewanella avicenniae]|uniref:Ribosome rescue factor SmrB n=1 Tax=Shewanella avicenniae TaxID=2814294 RepID=A0ABX7QU02_9GAMM|nr:endonuclease SmrB [Shewanella avicenniae]QSX34967.1 endonuclease SmrB [Shewanella avicenniae]